MNNDSQSNHIRSHVCNDILFKKRKSEDKRANRSLYSIATAGILQLQLREL